MLGRRAGPAASGTATAAAGPGPPAVARRTIATLLTTQSIGSAAFFGGLTAGAVLAADLLEERTWVGLPNSFAVLGAAAASVPVSRYMQRAGRRRGLVLAYLVAIAGACLAVLAAGLRSFPLLVAAMLLFGAGQTANHLSRFAAGDVVPAARRGRAISMVVWGATVGALLGPNLLGLAGAWAAGLRLPELAGPFCLAVLGFGAALGVVWARLRPDPLDIARQLGQDGGPGPGGRAAAPLRAPLSRPAVQVALAAMVGSYLVMVMVMSMTPVHMRGHDHGLAAIGLVISGHLVGMFAFSPLVGWASDRAGRGLLITAGALVLALGTAMSAAADPDGRGALGVALFLVGIGWNLAFVTGSALLTDALAPEERAGFQGLADAAAGAASAAGSLVAGVVFEARGFPALGATGSALMLGLMLLVGSRRRALGPARAAAGPGE